MDADRSLNLTLPDDLADMVREKVAAGAYASEGEVVRAGLALLAAQDEAVDGWLHARVAPAYDRALAAPGSALSASDVRDALAAAVPRKR